MQFQYFRPRADIKRLVSSYYDVTVESDIFDIMRAEIANVRFIIRGEITSDINGADEKFKRGAAILCGPTYQWSHVSFAPGTQIFGAAITPLGWARLINVPAHQLADKIVPLVDCVPPTAISLMKQVVDASDNASRVGAADALFAAMVDRDKRVDEVFLDQITTWITSPDPNELTDLFAEMALSERQIERLCNKYFGSAPKLLHRKFRALHSANRLTWQNLTDWRDIATTAYSDQSHFIREFKQFNGRSPSDFIKGTHILVRTTLHERLQIEHGSPFSLIG